MGSWALESLGAGDGGSPPHAVPLHTPTAWLQVCADGGHIWLPHPHPPPDNATLSSGEKQLAVRPLPSPDSPPIGPEEPLLLSSVVTCAQSPILAPVTGEEPSGGQKGRSAGLGVGMLSNGLWRASFQFKTLLIPKPTPAPELFLLLGTYHQSQPYEVETNTRILWVGKWRLRQVPSLAQGHQLAGMGRGLPGPPALRLGHTHSSHDLLQLLCPSWAQGKHSRAERDRARQAHPATETPDLPSQNFRRNGFPWRWGANLG